MRQRCYILNGRNFEPGNCEGPNCRFPSGSRTFYFNINADEAKRHRLFCGNIRSLRRCKCSAFPGTFEPASSRSFPDYHVSSFCSECNMGIVKGRLNMCDASRVYLSFFLFTLCWFISQWFYPFLPTVLFPSPTVRFLPFRVRALVLVLCPFTGIPRRWRSPL